MKSLIRFLEKVLSIFFKSRYITYIDFEDYEDYVRNEDVSKRETLLGAIRTKEQYDINLRYKFYHIPIDAVDSPDEVKYVALYRSKNFFKDEEPGVINYGKVISFEKVKRRDIKELYLNFSPESLYYRFNVLRWETLNSTVKAKEIGPINGYMTSFYLLNNSHYVYELYCENNDEFKLSLALFDLVMDVYQGLKVNDYRVYLKNKRIIVFSSKAKFSFKVSDYKRAPYETLEKIYSIIF